MRIKTLAPIGLLLLCMLAGCRQGGQVEQESTITKIQQRGTLLVGSTGDYRPLSFRDSLTDTYWGLDVDLCEIIAHGLGVKAQYVPTSWPTLTADMQQENGFDMALCGITITSERQEHMLMSEGYIDNGKTILCRKEEANRYRTLEDLNQPEVRVMVNPGGLNEKFARAHLNRAQMVVHTRNEEIPSLIANGVADVMITELVEAPYYVQQDNRLAAPLCDKPFNRGQIGVLMRKGEEDLLQYVNGVIQRCKQDGTLQKLHIKYGLPYGF